MKLKLESEEFRFKLENNLDTPLLSRNRKQLADPHDFDLIIWHTLRTPMYIKLGDQIYRPIQNQLENTHI